MFNLNKPQMWFRWGLWHASPLGYEGCVATTGSGKTQKDAWQTMELRVKAAELRQAGELSRGWEWRTLATGSMKGQRVLCRMRTNPTGSYWEYLEGGTAHVLFADVEPIRVAPSRQQDSTLETRPQLLAGDSDLHIASVLTTDSAQLQSCTPNMSQHQVDLGSVTTMARHGGHRPYASPTLSEVAALLGDESSELP